MTAKNAKSSVPLPKPPRTRYTVVQALHSAGLDPKYDKHLTTPAVAKAMAKAAQKVIKRAEKDARKKLRLATNDLITQALEKE